MSRTDAQEAIEMLLRSLGVDANVMLLINESQQDADIEEIDDLKYQNKELQEKIVTIESEKQEELDRKEDEINELNDELEEAYKTIDDLENNI